jgi:hypothetical protein
VILTRPLKVTGARFIAHRKHGIAEEFSNISLISTTPSRSACVKFLLSSAFISAFSGATLFLIQTALSKRGELYSVLLSNHVPSELVVGLRDGAVG